jgi:protein subunit release factor A
LARKRLAPGGNAVELKDEDIETLCYRPGPDEVDGLSKMAICLHHKPTGIRVVCDDYPSQVKNKEAALVQLAEELRKSQAT